MIQTTIQPERIPSARNLPTVTGVRWFNFVVLAVTPAIATCGLFFVPIDFKTMVFAMIYYVFSMLGITAGYHRLWSHRSYRASFCLQLFLLFGGSSAVQGSCLWWARAHRSHHRHTDTDLDPYDARRGLFWTHIGWVIFRSDIHPGKTDISDLRRDGLIQWQHRWYFILALIFGYAMPTVIPGLFWGNWLGGFCFSGALRLTVAHHSTFCINSIAHRLGSASYDDTLTPRDHFVSAILTMGEGYHNFHHQFPMDYRNAFLWYQYDPTKWFIAACSFLGLANDLRVFPANEIQKGALAMKLKELKRTQDALAWPSTSSELPVVSWETFQNESKSRTLILIAGYIHDVSSFVDSHPGGCHVLINSTGEDMTTAFYGGIYSHSNAAHNLLSMLRIGVLIGATDPPGNYKIPFSRLHVSRRL